MLSNSSRGFSLLCTKEGEICIRCVGLSNVRAVREFAASLQILHCRETSASDRGRLAHNTNIMEEESLVGVLCEGVVSLELERTRHNDS